MPTKPRRYPKEIPDSQFRTLREIALAGELSVTKLTERLEVTHASTSGTVKVLQDRRMIEISRVDSTKSKGGKPEKYYTLSMQGLKKFISRIPSPEEFFQVLSKSYNLKLQTGWLNTMSIEDLELYYESYKQKYLGYASAHAYVVQSPFFNKLYEQWLAEYRQSFFAQYHLKNVIKLVHSPFIEKCFEKSLEISDLNGITIAQKVLECLAIHRSITEKQIKEYLNSQQKLIEKKLTGKTFEYPNFIKSQIEFHYAITPDNIRRVIDRYTLKKSILNELKQSYDALDYDVIVKKYLEFLSRLAIVRTDSVDGPRYELSLVGVMLTLAIVTHPHQKMFYKDSELGKNNSDLIKFYTMVSQNYVDKLPLIFGKWALLTRARNDAYDWFLPVLYQKLEDEFARAIRPGSATVTNGGVKEYLETMQEMAVHTTVRLFDLYRGLSSVLSSSNQVPLMQRKAGLVLKQKQKAERLALKQKQNELAALLKYSDLAMFIDGLKHNNKNSTHIGLAFNSELAIIEKALASETTFLFYINLARNRFLDYTDEGRNFLGDERDTDYSHRFSTDDETGETVETYIPKPIDYLTIILKSDVELKNMFQGWMADIIHYRGQVTKHIEKFDDAIKKWKNRSVGII